MRRAAWRRSAAAQGGFLTVQFVAAVGLSLLLLVMLANVIVVQYGGGVVRAAVDEGVRRGSRAGPAAVAECQERAAAVVADLLGGGMGVGVAPITCADLGDRVTAETAASFPAWLPGLPDWSLTARAVAVREEEP